MFKINYTFGQAHWIVPPAVIGFLAILLVIILIRRGIRCAKENTPFINLNKQFMAENWDKMKLLGSMVLLLIYPFAMKAIHFLPASIILIFFFNILYCGVDKLLLIKQGGGLANEGVKSVVLSLVISIIGSVVTWFVFGTIFQVTLP